MAVALAMDSLISFVFRSAVYVIKSCEEAKQCVDEVVRIAMRTQNLLGTLSDARENFQESARLEASLLELKDLFERIHRLVSRCSKPLSMKDYASVMWNGRNPNKVALLNSEQELERITQDLGLPMLSDIKKQLNRMQESAQQAQANSATSAGRDAEGIAQIVREEILRAMAARGKGGATVQDAIDKEIAALEREDGCSRQDRALDADDGAKAAGSSAQAAPSASSTSRYDRLVVRLGRVNTDHLEEGDVLGEGTFGTVRAGTYRGREVAVKKARGTIGSAQIMDEFRHEAEIHYTMRHPYIVEVIAFSVGDSSNPPCMVMERMHESLYDVMGIEGLILPIAAKISILGNVCEGMQFLHDHGIVHRDLKSLNILLDEACSVAKISDFGLAEVNSSVASSTGGYHSKVGSDYWMAPEVHDHHKATTASDVFSLHVVMWETIFQRRASTGKPIGERLLSIPDAHLPLDLESIDCSDMAKSHMESLLQRCGYGNQSDRPTMDEICSLMSSLLQHLKDPDKRQLAPPEPSAVQGTRRYSPARAQGPGLSRISHKDSDRRLSDSHATDEVYPLNTRGSEFSTGSSGSRLASRRDSLSAHTKVSSLSRPESKGRPLPPLPPRRPSASAGGVASTVTSFGQQSDDRRVLAHLFARCAPPQSLNKDGKPAGWFISRGWGSAGPLCGWYGVTTQLDGSWAQGSERVTKLTLVKNGLYGKIPSSFKDLRALRLLDLSRNKLTGSIPSELADIDTMTDLELQHNYLSGEIPETLGKMPMLKTLDISHNKMSGEIPKELGRIKSLRVLRLGSNQFSGEMPDALSSLDILEELDLGGNKLTGTVSVKSGTWPRLQILDLSSNSFEGWIPPEVLELQSLTHLHLDCNLGLTGGIPPWLGRMQTLREINLSATQLGGKIPRELGDITYLKMLSLGSAGLQGAIPSELGKLRSLTHLSLLNNKLSGEIPPALVRLPALRHLNLERNELTVTRSRSGGTKNEIKKTLRKGCVVRL